MSNIEHFLQHNGVEYYPIDDAYYVQCRSSTGEVTTHGIVTTINEARTLLGY